MNDALFYMVLLQLLLAISLGALTAWVARKIISDLRKKNQKKEVKFPVK